MAERKWNKEQLEAITAFGGDLLVSAAAGSGKTAVLVERIIRMLTRWTQTAFWLLLLRIWRRRK